MVNHQFINIKQFLFILLFSFPLCFSVYAQEKVKPKDGDGIYSLLRRHNRVGENYVEEFIKLNKDKLGKGNSLQFGIEYELPPKSPLSTTNIQPTDTPPTTGKKGKESLFGTKSAEYDIVSEELKGAVFYVVSGHGGPDPGAIGKMGSHELHEDEYAYDITLRLAKSLMMRGAKVHMIIVDPNDGIRDDRILKNSKNETCMGEAIPLKQFARLNQRCEKINTLYKKEKPTYSRAVFIHIDSRTIHKRLDVFFFHSGSKESKLLAQTMRKTFSDKYRKHQPSRGFSGFVEERGLYVLNQTTPVALFVELGNIQNSYDQQRFILSNNRQALANWLCEGFITDYKSHKKKKED